MKKIFIIILSHLLISFNTFVFAVEKHDEKFLKIGILAPFTGELKGIGEEILYSVNLALHDINDPSIKIYPKDSGSKNEKIIQACEEFQNEEIKIIIGPVDSTTNNELNNYENLIFLSLSNIDSGIKKNVVMMGINLESQLLAIKQFLKKQKKNKTVILYPKNEYSKHVEKNVKLVSFNNPKIFKYDQDPKKLTKQIEKITNYKQRKTNLEARIKKLEKSEKSKDIRELNMLKQKYTLGKINFDSVIIIDFGDSLKSALTSLVYSDVNQNEVMKICKSESKARNKIFEKEIKNIIFVKNRIINFIS